MATASEFHAVLAKGQGKTRATYLRRVVTERLTGKPIETYSNDHMLRGQSQESMARLAYEAATGEPVELIGFIKHPTLQAGCSPDGLISHDGLAEFKCVIPTVQLETWLRGDYPPEHKPQLQGGLWLAKRAWADFASYSPEMPEHLRLYVVRVQRDEEYIAMLEREVIKFLREVDAMVERLMRMRMPLTEALKASLERTAA